jgi:hypothetical protein
MLEPVWGEHRDDPGGDMTVDDVVRATSYLRDAPYAGPNAAARVAALGGRAVATTAIVAQTLAEDWLVEIEVIATGRAGAQSSSASFAIVFQLREVTSTPRCFAAQLCMSGLSRSPAGHHW